MPFYRMSLLALPLMLSGCATIVEGSDQTVSIITYPPEASCKLLRGGEVLAFVNTNPGHDFLGEERRRHHRTLCERGSFR